MPLPSPFKSHGAGVTVSAGVDVGSGVSAGVSVGVGVDVKGVRTSVTKTPSCVLEAICMVPSLDTVPAVATYW